VVGIYVGVLKRLAAKRKFEVLVHPVPPVLNETRAVVSQFNAALEAAVRKAPALTWLDFVGKMLSEDGNSPSISLTITPSSIYIYIYIYIYVYEYIYISG